jgi:hypothetical protein
MGSRADAWDSQVMFDALRCRAQAFSLTPEVKFGRVAQPKINKMRDLQALRRLILYIGVSQPGGIICSCFMNSVCANMPPGKW